MSLKIREYTKPLTLKGEGGAEEPGQAKEFEEEDDNLRSKSYVQIIDAVSEGEIEGFCQENWQLITDPADIGKALLLDGVPFMTDAGRQNFRGGIRISTRLGTQTQSAVEGFDYAMDTISIGQALLKDFPLSTAITNPDVDSVLVGVRISGLYIQGDSDVGGVLVENEVEWKIHVSLNGAPFTEYKEINVRGKTSSDYIKQTTVILPKSSTPGSDSWVIKVSRDTENSVVATDVKNTSLDYITTRIATKLKYPNTAYFATKVSARYFASIPNRAFRLKGIKVKVPSNYNPETRVYTGNWNGSFVTKWTNNPAWIFYDLLTNKRYGLGDYIETEYADKWSLYKIAKYCDELVKTGYSGYEPRFTCNCYLQSRETAYKVMNDIASVFRGMIFWANGVISVVQDSPKAFFTEFNAANVKDGIFVYAGASAKTRNTVVVVRWNDPDDLFKLKFEYVEDTEAIATYGLREQELTAFGCTSRGQARRLGLWLIYTQIYETETATWVTGFEGAVLKPGDVVKVFDNNRATVQNSGRIVAISPDRLTLTLDRSITFKSASACKFSVITPATLLEAGDVTNSSQIDQMRKTQLTEYMLTQAVNSTHTTITLPTALPAGTDTGAIWVFEDVVSAQLFRVTNIEESGPNEFKVTALKYFSSKYDFVEKGVEFEIPPVEDVDPQVTMNPPRGVTLTTKTAATSSGVKEVSALSWEPPAGTPVTHYVVQTKEEGISDWSQPINTTNNYYNYTHTSAAKVEFRLTAVGVGGKVSDTIQLSKTPTNVIAEPANGLFSVEDLQVFNQGTDLTLKMPDIMLTWRLASTKYPEFGTDSISAASQTLPIYFDFYIVRVLSGATVLMTSSASTNRFTLPYNQNKLFPGGPLANLTFEVAVKSNSGIVSPYKSITLVKEVLLAPSALVVEPVWNAAMIRITHTKTDMVRGYRIYMGPTATFAAATLIGELPGTAILGYTATHATNYYFWVTTVGFFNDESAPFPPAASAGVMITTPTVLLA